MDNVAQSILHLFLDNLEREAIKTKIHTPDSYFILWFAVAES